MLFSFASFMKLGCLSRSQRDAALSKRLLSNGGGYDFHKRTYGFCADVVSGIELPLLLKRIGAITYEVERRSIVRGVTSLSEWLTDNSGSFFPVGPLTVTSPSGLFGVRLAPQFGLERQGIKVAYQLWNTMWPDLHPDARDACICLEARKYAQAGVELEFQVLSLISKKAYASAVDHPRVQRLADELVENVEGTITRLRRELGLPGAESPSRELPPSH